jgi:hypothetical protein
MATTQTPAPPVRDTPVQSAQSAPSARTGLRNLLLDVAVPVGSYYAARAAGADLFTALVISSALPLVRTGTALVRGRRVDGLALLVLVVNAAGLAVSFWSGNPRFMLAKDGVTTAVLGIAVLISVLANRPLMTAGMRPFVTKGNAAKDAAFGRLLASSGRFGQLNRRFSVVWGIAFLAECAARVTCAVTLPVNTTMWLSNVLLGVCILAAVIVGGRFADKMEKLVSAELPAVPAQR